MWIILSTSHESLVALILYHTQILFLFPSPRWWRLDVWRHKLLPQVLPGHHLILLFPILQPQRVFHLQCRVSMTKIVIPNLVGLWIFLISLASVCVVVSRRYTICWPMSLRDMVPSITITRQSATAENCRQDNMSTPHSDWVSLHWSWADCWWGEGVGFR